MIRVIDYGMGNLQSVINAFEAAGAAVAVATRPEELRAAAGIVLPGVGAFGDGMHNLDTRGFTPVLHEQVLQNGKPFLGLCLGMQLIATHSYEHGKFAGLGWLDATVERLPGTVDGVTQRVPHVGWNDVRLQKKEGLYSGVADGESFYFVHSFAVREADPAVVSATSTYGVEFAASVEWANIFATQFHPEKSHKAGLALLRNFAAIVDESHA